MLQFVNLYEEAKAQLSKQQPQLALVSFQTLLTLLNGQRAKDKKLIHQVTSYIDSIVDPIGFAARQHQLHEVARNNERLAQQQQAIDEASKSADDYYQIGHFEMAANRYSEAVNLLSHFKQRRPNDLGHAYWNFAMANISWASQLQQTDATKATLLKEQATLQIQAALLAYPHSAKKHLNACQAKLTELTTFLITQENSQSIIDVEEFSGEQLTVEKPAVLHWKKALLQRYLLEQQQAITMADQGSPVNPVYGRRPL